jgi:hypothetical protein
MWEGMCPRREAGNCRRGATSDVWGASSINPTFLSYRGSCDPTYGIVVNFRWAVGEARQDCHSTTNVRSRRDIRINQSAQNAAIRKTRRGFYSMVLIRVRHRFRCMIGKHLLSCRRGDRFNGMLASVA